MRQAAAAGRQALLKLASDRLGSPADALQVTDGVVSVTASPAKKISYADLVGGKRFNVKIVATGTGWDLKVAPEVPAKDPRVTKLWHFRAAHGSAAKVHRRIHLFGGRPLAGDAARPRVRPPTVNTKPASGDESSIKDIAGVVKVVQEGSFLGVVAQTEWAAIQAAKALKVLGPRRRINIPRPRKKSTTI